MIPLYGPAMIMVRHPHLPLLGKNSTMSMPGSMDFTEIFKIFSLRKTRNKKLIILFLLIISFYSYAQISNYKDKTVQQLSGIESGVTSILSKNYWETYCYAEIKAIMDRQQKIKYTSDYADIQTAIDSAAVDSSVAYIMQGLHSITAKLETENNIMIQGSGFGSVIQSTKSAQTALSLMEVKHDTNVIITNLTFKTQFVCSVAPNKEQSLLFITQSYADSTKIGRIYSYNITDMANPVIEGVLTDESQTILNIPTAGALDVVDDIVYVGLAKGNGVSVFRVKL